MKECKFVLKKICRGFFCQDVEDHLAECPSCSAVYEKEIQLNSYLLRLADVDAPDHLKRSVLQEVSKVKKKLHLLPSLQMVLRTAGFGLIAVVGFWLGIQTANGNTKNGSTATETVQSQPYSLNTAALDQSSLSEIYFKVVEEAGDETK